MQVLSFQEKPQGDGSWINAGFFVCQPEVFDYIPDGDGIIFEREPLENLAIAGQLVYLSNIMASGSQWILNETKIYSKL